MQPTHPPRYRVVACKGGIGFAVARDTSAEKVAAALTGVPFVEPPLVSTGPWHLSTAKKLAQELNDEFARDNPDF